MAIRFSNLETSRRIGNRFQKRRDAACEASRASLCPPRLRLAALIKGPLIGTRLVLSGKTVGSEESVEKQINGLSHKEPRSNGVRSVPVNKKFVSLTASKILRLGIIK